MSDLTKYLIRDTATIRESLVALNNLSGDVQTLFVIDEANRMVGTLTDGDIRRTLINGYTLDESITVAMHREFKYLIENNIDVELIKKLRLMNIGLLPFLDQNKHIVKIYNLKKNFSVLPIDAVLMAGGKGERLRPLTETKPKPLLIVGKKTIIDHNVENLMRVGVENIYITVNYLKEQIESHFSKHENNINITCIREENYLGTIGAVRNIDSFKKNVILVMNSDIFTNINFEDFFIDFVNSDADMSVATIPYSVNIPYGIFDFEGSKIQSIKEKPTFHFYANAGIYLIKKEILDLIPINTYYDATHFIDTLISNGYKVTNFSLTGYWIDIGKMEDYKKAQEFAKHL